MPNVRIDPMLVSILQRRFKSITEEMGLTLLRTTRSPILNEARDFVTGLYDRQGRMLEQTEYIPILAFALQPSLKAVIDYFGDDVHPGDVFMHNDVFSGGNQNADVAIFKPVFLGEELIGWAACKGHQADIGGNAMGGYNPEAREVWQEALRIPPVKVFERGTLRRDVWDLIFANIRLKLVEEDLRAHIGGCVVGERRFLELATKYGVDVLYAHIDYFLDATEKRMREEIRRIPDGSACVESYAWGDAIDDDRRLLIKLRLTVRDDEIEFDYEGTSPQTEGFVNAPLSSTRSAVMLCTLMMVDPDMPHNDGLLRPIRVHVPEGCFLNAQFPAATTFGNTLAGPNSDAIFKAFHALAPDRVCAGWNRALNISVSGWEPHTNRRWADILFLALKGGSGATAATDGYDHIGLINCAGGILAQDCEMIEIQDPLLLHRHEYLCDSAGAGERRGGLGVGTELEFLGDETTLVTFGDGVKPGSEAFGLNGGQAGCSNEVLLTYPDGHTHVPKTKELVRGVPRGAMLRQVAGGGGGFGDPRLRSRSRLREEVEDGIISPEAAKQLYGLEG